MSIIALAINCSINFMLITGQLGLPELGARGAAIGTLAARIVECMIVAVCFFRGDKRLSFKVRELFRIDRDLMRDFFRVSLPIIFCDLLWGCNTALQTVVLGHMSSSAIAAHSISSTIFLFLKVMAVGAASAASVIIGKAVGSGDLEKVREYTRTLQLLFIAIGLITGAALLLIRRPLLSVYALSAETYDLANGFILVEVSVLVFMSYQMCVNAGIIRGGGDTRYVMVLDVASICLIVIPFSILSAFVWKLSPVAVMIVLNADQYFKCIPAAVYGNSYRWIHTLTRER